MPGGDRLLQYEQEIEEKKEALLELPEQLGETQLLVEELQNHLQDLHERIKQDNSWHSKIKDYILGGIIGAIIGVVFSLLFL
ncbi:MAG: hypothetical protein P9L97_06915 [Candidatus Tenebribacter davisii]|jgi:uncharacterized coiled-coil protein SlyX|nr:hypothetical protein [Candidatus Tenebribacter davisii]